MQINITPNQEELISKVPGLRDEATYKEECFSFGDAAHLHKMIATIYHENNMLPEARREWADAIYLYENAIEKLISDRPMKDLNNTNLRNIIVYSRDLIECSIYFEEMAEIRMKYIRIRILAEQLKMLRKETKIQETARVCGGEPVQSLPL